MLLRHFAAILFFGGPLFYCGLWMALDPAVFERSIEVLARAFTRGKAGTRPRMRSLVRCAGMLLVLLALAL